MRNAKLHNPNYYRVVYCKHVHVKDDELECVFTGVAGREGSGKCLQSFNREK